MSAGSWPGVWVGSARLLWKEAAIERASTIEALCLAAETPRPAPDLILLIALLLCGARGFSAQAVRAAVHQAPNSRVEVSGAYGYFNLSGSNAHHYLIQTMGSLPAAGRAGYFTRPYGVEAEGFMSAPGTRPDNPLEKGGRGRRTPHR